MRFHWSPSWPFNHTTISTLTAAFWFLCIPATGLVQEVSEKPELRLRTGTRFAFAPAEVLFVAELRDGPDDYEEFYCASVEWVWDDDTRSETIPDCDPYEAGNSEIRRRFSMRHTFQRAGRYEIRLNLKQRDDVVASARTTVEIRGGRGFR